MAIAYISSGNGSSASSSNPTFSFSVPSSNLMLVVALQMSNNGSGASAVSYGGQAMTQVGSEIAPQANLRASLWYLYNPPTGSNTLAVTGSSSLNNTTIAYSLFSGVKSTSPIDSNGSNTGTGISAITASTTVVASNCWLIGGCWQGATINSMTNATNRSTSAGNCTTIFDSNGTVATGSRSVTCTYSANDSQGMILASFLQGSTDVTVTPSALALTFSVPAYAVKTGRTIVASVLAATFSLPSRVVALPKTVLASVLSAVFSIPAYSAGGQKIVTPNVVSATFSVPTYAVSVVRNIIVAVNALVATFSTPSRSIGQGTGVTVLASALTGTFSVPTYTVTVERNITVIAGVLSLTFSVPTLRKVGTIWTRRARSTDADWTRVGRNST